MQLYANKFLTHLDKNGLPAFVLVFGDEPQQKLEIIDAVRQWGKQNGFDERQTLVADSDFSWAQLIDATQTMSLFSDKQYIELTLPTGKPGTEGSKVLSSIAEAPSADTLVLIQGPKIAKDVQKAKWFKALDSVGLFIHTYPLEGNALLQWIKAECQQKQIQLSSNGINILADSSEGNLMAAKQEIEKLSLLADSPNQMIDDKALTAAIVNQSRFTAFQLTDDLLAGNMQKAIKILQRLESEGTEPNIILWALVKEAQTLQACQEMQIMTGNINFNQLRIWANKQSLYRNALGRLSAHHISIMLEDLQQADLILKSQQLPKPYVLLSHLALLFVPATLPRLA